MKVYVCSQRIHVDFIFDEISEINFMPNTQNLISVKKLNIDQLAVSKCFGRFLFVSLKSKNHNHNLT